MLAKITRLALDRGIDGEISLEGRMACGVGACLGCSHPVLTDGNRRYAKICSDGPVFRIGEMLLHNGDGR